MKRVLFIALAIVIAAACGKTASSLTATGAAYQHADEGVVALGTLQHVAVELNKLQVCAPAPAPPACHPALSDHNTGVVVDAVTLALTTAKAAPAGWKATVNACVASINSLLDAAGKVEIAAYLNAALSIVNAF